MFKSGIIFLFLTFSLVIQTTGIPFIKSTSVGLIENKGQIFDLDYKTDPSKLHLVSTNVISENNKELNEMNEN